jgi:hypothetical protein
MKKLVAILMSGMLFADDIPPIEGEIHSFLEVAPLEKTSTDESEIQGVYETDEPIEQVISYVKGDYIILDKGLVLTANESEYLQLFDEDDDVLVLKISGGYVLLHNLTQVEVMCKEVGRVVENDLSTAKIFSDMIELSNGDLYLLENKEEYFWERAERVFVVKTERGHLIIDRSFGFSEPSTFLGKLDKLKSLDFVQGVKGHHLHLLSTGSLRSLTEDLGSLENWSEGDEIILQKFTFVNIGNFDPLTPFILAHNVTKDEVAITVLLRGN